MDFPRSTLAIILYEWIKQREAIEKKWGYTGDSAILATARLMFTQTQTSDGEITVRSD